MMRRRRFLKLAGAAGLSTTFLSSRLFDAKTLNLVVLFTNDVHSQIDPLPEDGSALSGLGGAARRAALIRRIRARNPNVLLLDSGDIFQGTPYFNFFKGELEFRVMSEMGYDVATLGNHDFDNGVEGLVDMLPHATFDFVSANYRIDRPTLRDRVAPSVVREFEGVKVGIFGLGIELGRVSAPELFQGISYLDPVLIARRHSEDLRNRGCDLVICLSHLGYDYGGTYVGDVDLAEEVPEIDLILGGHTHTFLDEPRRFRTGETDFTLVHQMGRAGARLGRIDIAFDPILGRPEPRASSFYPVDRRLDPQVRNG